MPRTEKQKAHRRAYEKNRWKTKPEICRAQRMAVFARRYQQVHGRAVWMLQNAKTRAKARGLQFSVSVEWVKERLNAGRCEMTGIEFDWSTERQDRSEWARPFAPSIERRDPKLGYTEENCAIVAWIVNRAKANFLIEDFDRMCREYIKLNPTPFAAAHKETAL